MRFCIFTAREPQDAAEMCVTTIRHHHPDAEIWHLTDEETPQVKGTDAAKRAPWCGSMQTIMGLRMEHLSRLDDAPTVILDTDILLRRRVDDVFRVPFDVALTKRADDCSPMPFNTGVMFSRRGDFWRAMLERMEIEPRFKAFLTEQEGVAIEAQSGKWDVFVLTMAEWNCADMAEDKIPAARILHYKGPRKKMMRGHFERKVWQ